MADFSGARAKLDRAEKHLRTFERVLRFYLKSEPVRLVSESNANGRSEDVRIEILKELPAHLPLVFGDCVHNVRSSLDHMVMALAVERGHSNVRASFPIADRPEWFFGEGKPIGDFSVKPIKNSGRWSIRWLSTDAQTFTEGLQPYHRRDHSWVLTELQHLDNWDKHRILLTHFFQNWVEWSFTHPGITVEYARPVRIEHRARLCTVSYAETYDGPMKVQPPLNAEICVERSNGMGVLAVQRFLRVNLLPRVAAILDEAITRFP